MNFTKTHNNENYFVRYISENEVWEVGFTQVLFGVRVRAGLVGSGCCVIDYCAGAEYGWQVILLMVVTNILEKLPESITEREISRMLPCQEIKPMSEDSKCWESLLSLPEDLNIKYPKTISK